MTSFTLTAPDGSGTPEPLHISQSTSLVNVIDRLLHIGVVLEGDVTLGVANVDLIYLGVRLILCSADRLLDTGSPTGLIAPNSGDPPLLDDTPPSPPLPASFTALAPPSLLPARAGSLSAPLTVSPAADALPPALPRPASSGERGLAQLVLTLVELLRDLMERQAIRRMDQGSLTEAQITRLGDCLMQIADRMEELKTLFELTDDDLNLDLGPLGKLLD